MKIKKEEIIPKEHLFENNYYFIKYNNQKIALFKNNELHIFDKKQNLKSIPYEQSNVFAWYKNSNDFKNLESVFKSEDYLEEYENEKNILISKRPQYSGIFIEDSLKNKILEEAKINIPRDWKIYLHHMTINLGGLKEENKALLGKESTLTCTELGFSKELQVMAFKVETNIPSSNKIKHITIAVGEESEPYLSNKIEYWTPLENKIEIKGKIGEFLQDKTINFGNPVKNNLKNKIR